LLVKEVKWDDLYSTELVQAGAERFDHGITFPMRDNVELGDSHDWLHGNGISAG
jgi:hypothetical protein